VNNAELFDRSLRVIPGGVNSPVRAFRAVGGTPVFFANASGAWLTDVEGRRFVDYVGSWGPMILGHSHPAVVKAVQETAARGLVLGVAEPMPATLRVGSELSKCASESGTEATRAIVSRGSPGAIASSS
jgi:glutamate-1-semialdehyde 2,1-aminomutase